MSFHWCLRLVLFLFLGGGASGWTGSELNHILPEPKGDVVDLLKEFFPMAIGEFFQEYYDTKMILLKQNDTKWNPDSMWNVSQFEAMYEAFVNSNMHTSHISVHAPRDQNGKSVKKSKLSADTSFAEVQHQLDTGSSFVFRFEYIPEATRPLFELERALRDMTGIPVSIHMYVSAAGAKVLNPHTDPYDVMVFQIEGRKNWTACVPVPEVCCFAHSFFVC